MFTEVMPDSVGNRLCKARLARGLTIDEAAHATKMRPDKILALENDDYSRFANNAYAKGFLLIYGRFLRVDVSDQARSLAPVGRGQLRHARCELGCCVAAEALQGVAKCVASRLGVTRC